MLLHVESHVFFFFFKDTENSSLHALTHTHVTCPLPPKPPGKGGGGVEKSKLFKNEHKIVFPTMKYYKNKQFLMM